MRGLTNCRRSIAVYRAAVAALFRLLAFFLSKSSIFCAPSALHRQIKHRATIALHQLSISAGHKNIMMRLKFLRARRRARARFGPNTSGRFIALLITKTMPGNKHRIGCRTELSTYVRSTAKRKGHKGRRRGANENKWPCLPALSFRAR